MRVEVGNLLLKEPLRYERHSYLDATDEIFTLPLNVLKVSFRRPRRPAWPEQCPKEDLREFLLNARALASHI